jgi:hypothetical protein
LLLVVLPVVLAIKNWDTTLKAIKMLLKFVMTSTPKVIKFIIAKNNQDSKHALSDVRIRRWRSNQKNPVNLGLCKKALTKMIII